MQTAQLRWTPESGWKDAATPLPAAQLVLVFGDADYFHSPDCYAALKARFPVAHIVGCSSAGNVQDTRLSEGDVVATAVYLEHGQVRIATADVNTDDSVQRLAAGLMQHLLADDLRHVLVLSDGTLVNGSELAKGLNGAGVAVTGGLAGDGSRFDQTWVMADAPACNGRIVAIGWYGALTVKSGCFAGWDTFGAERLVTRSAGNVVYEIDNQPALALYKKYLGELAQELPSSGLRFPLSVYANKTEQPIIRTLLAVDEQEQSLTFAGDVPQGHWCKLMKTNLDKIIQHAGMAAESAQLPDHDTPSLCIIVSCVGRRLVLGQLTEEELAMVSFMLGLNAVLTGFYSYGELAPFSDILQCQLHNQTMTLTTVYE